MSKRVKIFSRPDPIIHPKTWHRLHKDHAARVFVVVDNFDGIRNVIHFYRCVDCEQTYLLHKGRLYLRIYNTRDGFETVS